MSVRTLVRLVLAIVVGLVAANPAYGENLSKSVPQALVRAIERSGQFDSRYDYSTRTVKPFTPDCVAYSSITLRSGERITVVRGRTCGCGADNCQLAAFVRSGASYRQVLADENGVSQFDPDGLTTIMSHQSGAVSDRATYRWDGVRYVLQKREAVGYGITKPIFVSIRFATGSDFAIVRGRQLIRGSEDVYVLTARAGQKLSIDVKDGLGNVSDISVWSESPPLFHGPFGRQQQSIRLPRSGAYTIIVEGTRTKPAAYAMRIRID